MSHQYRLRRPTLENKTKEMPVGHPRSEREGGPCVKEITSKIFFGKFDTKKQVNFGTIC